MKEIKLNPDLLLFNPPEGESFLQDDIDPNEVVYCLNPPPWREQTIPEGTTIH